MKIPNIIEKYKFFHKHFSKRNSTSKKESKNKSANGMLSSQIFYGLFNITLFNLKASVSEGVSFSLIHFQFFPFFFFFFFVFFFSLKIHVNVRAWTNLIFQSQSQSICGKIWGEKWAKIDRIARIRTTWFTKPFIPRRGLS